MLRAARPMATTTRVAGDEEGEGGKAYGNDDNEDEDDNDNNDDDGDY